MTKKHKVIERFYRNGKHQIYIDDILIKEDNLSEEELKNMLYGGVIKCSGRILDILPSDSFTDVRIRNVQKSNQKTY